MMQRKKRNPPPKSHMINNWYVSIQMDTFGWVKQRPKTSRCESNKTSDTLSLKKNSLPIFFQKMVQNIVPPIILITWTRSAVPLEPDQLIVLMFTHQITTD